MKKQGFNQLLITGVLLCIFLTGCGEPAATENGDNGFESVTMEEASEEGVQENVAECGTTGQENAGNTQWPRDFEEVRERLAALPYNGEELKALAGTEDCPVPVYEIAFSNNYEGQYVAEQAKDFRLLLEAGEAAEILVMQYTVEGDLILNYLNFDGDALYRVRDASRDREAADPKYSEYTYDSVWFDTEMDEAGSAWNILYGLCEGDMVMEIFRTKSAEQSAEICIGLPPAEEQ